ncbi:FAD-containing oxidoreductase [Staphylococcus simiae]|uniref:hypothiocyanous acid reductase MerA n=1 Tax=Staphylococcus simiae TaxID=308354 RepID=UPI001A978DB9|nr:hypothiocyanous acid reductase MerA [Staphylococcus simiae]MBO1199595.1 FAD-containing oxidoreductase [Staphylococcus simiae]MBO1201629.1 FAD-containing oxidoreductase [Staphylococcus simiae]MBO1203749.1 FAD-containing oxidoreductase [Staphylococcus simiae]MBO1211602.1 FAD-containing oxidoreductase [Staphylococcus simiae]MBO1229988.1 FAD-containing oxidoreductase [Staphylococcus simiae]
MKHYDLIVIGFGKAGKTLAKYAASIGHQVAVVEQSQTMYGGTCINIGCIPSKTLVHDGIVGKSYTSSFNRKNDVVKALNSKNYHMLADDNNIDVLDFKAQFKSDDIIELINQDGQVTQTITAKHIVINTGAKAVIPFIKGIETAQHIYDSTGLLNIDFLPKHLVIVGGGYIALEFASMFANLGSKVTVLEHGPTIMPREEQDVVQHVLKDLANNNITIHTNVDTQSFSSDDNTTVVTTSQGEFKADAVLLATGRRPNTDELGLDNTNIAIGEGGEIIVNEHLQTSVKHIYAAGDVKGGLQFTYISLDDYRIIKSALYGDQSRNTNNRGAIPYTVFIDPPFSRVGLTASQAEAQHYHILEHHIFVNTIPRHKINDDARGMFKVIVDKDTQLVLGATLYGKESEELINLIKLAIDARLPYTVLRDNIYTHPTMTESFNDLFNI